MSFLAWSSSNMSSNSNSLKEVVTAVLKPLFLAVLYVGSLYIFGSKLPRDHPVTVKQRFQRVLLVCIISSMLVYSWVDLQSVSTMEKTLIVSRYLGLHFNNIIRAIVLPLFLTMILFFGPLMLLIFDQEEVNQAGSISLQKRMSSALYDVIWWRTFVVAPLTEEFVFRSCMLPILVPVFGLYPSVFLCPLFFGLAHVHHAIEGFRSGEKLFIVLLRAVFQMSYTTIFGAYSAFLFLRTGHLIGPVLCHSFCNFMGFPDFERISYSPYPKAVAGSFVAGLVVFIRLLFPLTEPSYYASIYWLP